MNLIKRLSIRSCLAACTLLYIALYAPSIDYGMFSDDYFFYQHPESVFKGPITNAFTLSQYHILRPEAQRMELDDSRINTSFRPVPFLTHWLDFKLFEGNVSIAHFHSLIWGLAMLIALFFTIYYWTQSKWLSSIGFILVAGHPLMVENYIWLAARSEIMSGLFLLLSFYFLSVGSANRSNFTKTLSLAGLFYFIAFFSKESAIFFCLIFPLFFVKRTSNKKLLAMCFTFFFISIFSMYLRSFAFGGSMPLHKLLDLMLIPGVWLQSLVDLAVPLWPGPARSIEAFYQLPGTIALPLVVAVFLWSFLKDKKVVYLSSLALISFFFLVLPLFPILTRTRVIGDRYLLFGFIFLIIFGLLAYREASLSRKTKLALRGLGLAASIFFVALGFQQSYLWGDHLELTRVASQNHPNSPRAQVLYGSALLMEGRTQEAIQLYEKSLMLNPTDLYVRSQLADILVKEKQYRKAEALLTAYIQSTKSPSPDFLFKRSLVRASLEKTEQACSDLAEFLKLEPNYAPAQNLFKAYCQSKD